MQGEELSGGTGEKYLVGAGVNKSSGRKDIKKGRREGRGGQIRRGRDRQTKQTGIL